MTLNLRKYDENRDVYVPPDIDSWYQLKFDHDSGYLVIIHHDRNEPLVKDDRENYREMRRVIQRASRWLDNGPSTIYLALDKVLNNYKDMREIKQLKDYDYRREYPLTKEIKRDLTDIANNLRRTGMPEDFIHYFFEVSKGGRSIIIRPVVTQADVTENKLNIQAMEEYVWSLKQLDDMPNFISKKEAGWAANGKPPLLKKYRKTQK